MKGQVHLGRQFGSVLKLNVVYHMLLGIYPNELNTYTGHKNLHMSAYISFMEATKAPFNS